MKPSSAERQIEREVSREAMWGQLAIFVIALAVWPLPVINPIKLMVVLFHELSHIAAAYLTGGVVIGMAIDPGGAGVTLGIDGVPEVIVAAGYVGSLLAGLLLYWLAAVWDTDEVWWVLILLCCGTLAFRWLNSFTAVFGWGALILMFIGAVYLNESTKGFILRWVATTSCLYPLIDVVSELLASDHSGFMVNGRPAASDVYQFSRMTGIPMVPLGAAWAIVGGGTVIWMMHWSARRQGRDEARRSLRRAAPDGSVTRAYGTAPFDAPRYRIR